MKEGDFSAFEHASFDLVLAAFTFDNIPGESKRHELLRDLRYLLKDHGAIILLCSTLEIYTHEWASFTTKEYPENRQAKSGEPVQIVMKDVTDRRPIMDLIWFPEDYLGLFAACDLSLAAQYLPLGRKDEPYQWIMEISIAPWVIYVVKKN